MESKEYLTTKEIAKILRVEPRTVLNLIARKEIPATKIGWEWRVERIDFIIYLDRNKTFEWGNRG